jgi:RNA polymerase sigma factor (sigma-70 family)
VLSKDTDRTEDVHKQVEAAHKLFTEHEVFIRSVIRYALSDPHDVDDCFNDLFLFFVSRPIPGDVQNLKGYLYKIIFDKAKDYRRRNIRYQQKLKGYAQDQADIYKANTMDETLYDERIQRILKALDGHLSQKEAQADIYKANTMDETLYDERIQRILKALDGHLSQKEAQAVRLRYREQHTIGQVAELMNIKPQSVKKYISVGLKKVRTLLGIQERADHDEGE